MLRISSLSRNSDSSGNRGGGRGGGGGEVGLTAAAAGDSEQEDGGSTRGGVVPPQQQPSPSPSRPSSSSAASFASSSSLAGNAVNKNAAPPPHLSNHSRSPSQQQQQGMSLRSHHNRMSTATATARGGGGTTGLTTPSVSSSSIRSPPLSTAMTSSATSFSTLTQRTKTSLGIEDEYEESERRREQEERTGGRLMMKGGSGTGGAKKQRHVDEKATAEARKNELPTPSQLEKAKRCTVQTEDGRTVEFAQVVRSNPGRGATVVIFVRHMWCGFCHEFLRALRHRVEERTWKQHGVQVVVIGCGDASLIKKYKDTAKFSGRMFTDPTCNLQETLGMTYQTLDPGTESEKGDYVQSSQLKNGLVSAANGIKMLSKGNPGKFDRLGGEMVFAIDPETEELRCFYAHRMTNTRSHGPLDRLFAAAGVSLSARPRLGLEDDVYI